MQSLSKLRLQFRIGLLATLGLSVAFAAFAFLGLRAVEERSAQIQNERLAMAQSIAEELDRSLNHARHMLTQMATRQGINPHDDNPEPERHALEDAYQLANLPTHRMLLVDRDGRVRLTVPETPDLIGLDLSAQAFVRRSLSSGQPAVSNTLPMNLLGQPVTALSVPVRDAQGQVAGLFVQTVDLLQPDLRGLLRHAQVGRSGCTELVDGTGTVIASTCPLNLLRTWKHRLTAPSLLETKEALVGIYPALNATHKANLLAFAPLSAASWSVTVEQDVDEALAPIRRLRRQFLALGLAALALALALIWIVIRLAVQPIQKLTAAAQRITHGELNHAIIIAPERQDEIGALARAFEDMRISLAAQRAVMKLRTRELSVLHHTALAGAEARSVDELATRITEILAAELYPETVGFLFLDPEREHLHLHPSYHGIASDMYDLVIPLGQGITGTVAQTGKPLLVPDIKADPRYIEVAPAVRSELGVPVRAGGQVVAVINVESAQGNAFSQEDLHLLSAVAGQVGTVLEKLQLFEEAQRRTTELEALREVSLDITAQLELSSLLQGIVRRAAELLEASSGSLYLYHSEQKELEFAVGHNMQADYTGTRLKVGEGISGQVVATGQPLTVDDHRTWEGRAAIFEHAPFQAVISVPLRWQERILGVINVADLGERRPFDENDLYLLEAFAQQAAVAIENARLHEEMGRQLNQLDVLYQVAEAGSRTLEFQPLLEGLLDRILQVTGMSIGAIYHLDQAAQKLHLAAHRGLPSEFVRQTKTYTPGKGITGQAAASGEPVVCEDTLQVPALREKAGGVPPTQAQIRSQISLPLKAGGKTIGVLNLNSEAPRSWTPDEVRWLETVARQAAISIENARLFETTEQRAAELEVLHQISLNLTASLELEPVLEAILEGVFKLLADAEDAHIFLYNSEDDRLTFSAARWADGRTSQSFAEPRQDGLTYTVARQGQPTVIPEVRTHPLFADAYLDWSGAIVSMPLKIGERVVGVMNVAYSEPHTFPETELRALRLLADQAAIAIENARLHQAEHSRVEESTVLLDIAQAVTSTLDPVQLLKQVALRTAQICRANRCTIFLVDPAGERLEPIMSQFANGHINMKQWHRFRTLGSEQVDAIPLFRQIIQQRQPVVVEDATREDILPHKWVEPFGIQKLLAVPLPSRDRVIGVMVLDHEDPAGRFSQDQVDLAMTIAGQVAVSIERARLFEAEQAARQRAETLQRVAATLGATLELEELLDRVLEGLQKVVPYDSASIQLLHDDQLEIIAGRGFPEPEKVIGLIFPLAGDNPNKEVIAQRQPVLVPDAPAAYADFREAPHSHIRSWLGAPLLHKDQVIGMITLDRTEVDAFSQEEANIALAFANHVAIALENARLFEDTAARSRELTTLYEASQAMSASLALDDVTETISRQLIQALNIEGCAISLREADDDHVVVISDIYWNPQQGFTHFREVEGEIYNLDEYPATAEVISTRQLQVVQADDPRADPAKLAYMKRYDVQTLLMVPLVVRDEAIGLLELEETRHRRQFSAAEIRLAQALANQAAITLENARLYEATRRQAVTDGLTGLYNVRYFYQALEKELERSRRYGHRCSLIMLDLDNFKRYNDCYGHLAGDDLLRELADLIRGAIRQVDTAARYGGEEFVVIVPETNGDRALALAERLRKAVHDHKFTVREGQQIGRITISVGVASYPKDAEDAEELVDAADMALLQAKEEKNRVYTYKR